MKFNKKMLLASTLTLSIFGAFKVQAEDKSANWAPRSVEEVKTDLVNQGDSSTYTVKYGDTLSTIAEAMSVDVNVLAKVNQISNINMIFPGTTITATYDAQHHLTGLTVNGTDNGSGAYQSASVDIPANEVTVGNTTTSLDTIETPASSEAPAASSEAAQASTAAPSEQTQTQTSEAAVADTRVTSEAAQVPTDSAAQANATATETATQSSTAEATPVSETSEADAAESKAPAQSEAPTAAAAEESASPVATEAASTDTTATAPAGTTVNTSGLQPSAAAFANNVANQYGITDIGGYRAGDSQDHGTGNAVDVMTYDNTQLGQEVANYATSNMEANNISYVIYQQKFYAPYNNVYGAAYTWNQMPDRGSDTANHYDHVHVSFNS